MVRTGVLVCQSYESVCSTSIGDEGDAPVGMFPISLPVFMLSVGTIQPKSIESTRTMNGIFF